MADPVLPAEVLCPGPAGVETPQLPPLPGELRNFTPEELGSDPSCSFINRKLSVSRLAVHPVGACVEYPACSSNTDEKVGHFFYVDPRPDYSVHPSENVQYSYSDGYSHKENISGYILSRETKMDRKSYYCRGIKSCEKTPSELYSQPHWSTSLPGIAAATIASREGATVSPGDRANQDLIQKTAAFFHSLSIIGCAYGEKDSDDTLPVDEDLVLPSRSTRRRQCDGRILLERTHDTGSPYLRCEHRKTGNMGHFFTSNIGSYDLLYLDALLRGDHASIAETENSALKRGYGPLAPCTFVTSSRSTRGICPYVHRDDQGLLNYGVLVDHPCKSKADWFVPVDLHTVPCILLVVHGHHNHTPPPPTHTPTPILRIVHWLLSLMEHRVAIATPRLLLRDEAVRAGVKFILKPPFGIVPCVSELHPSLDNYDHLDTIIKGYRTRNYPFGTDWPGLQNLHEQHAALPVEYRYVRRVVETSLDEGNGRLVTVRFIVCMLAAMSRQFLRTRILEADTSHKRVRGWLELTLGEWRNDLNRSVTLARVFWNSQSANAHCHALELVWDVIREDTGRVPIFRHLCTAEEQLTLWLIELMLIDDHKGQVLGIGLFLVKLASMLGPRMDLFEENRLLADLGPYDHLRRMLRLCLTHYVRHVRPFHGKETDAVYHAMLSLASADPLPDFDRLVSLIRREGSKDAQNWLAEKELSDRCGLRALYQPLSFIPVHIWKSAPSSTNARESAQGRDILSGKGLNLIGGVLAAWFDDRDEMNSLRSHLDFGISRHYTEPTAAHRAMSSLVRNAKQGKRTADEADVNLTVAVNNIAVLRGHVSASAAAVDDAPTAAIQAKRQRQHSDAVQQLESETNRLQGLIAKSSGRIQVDLDVAKAGLEATDLGQLFKTRLQLETHLRKQSVAQLKILCRHAILKTSGRKDELIDRLLHRYHPLEHRQASGMSSLVEASNIDELPKDPRDHAHATDTKDLPTPNDLFFPLLQLAGSSEVAQRGAESHLDDTAVPSTSGDAAEVYSGFLDMLMRY